MPRSNYGQTYNDNDSGNHTVDCTCPRCGWKGSYRIWGLRSTATLACPKCLKTGVEATEHNAGAVSA